MSPHHNKSIVKIGFFYLLKNPIKELKLITTAISVPIAYKKSFLRRMKQLASIFVLSITNDGMLAEENQRVV